MRGSSVFLATWPFLTEQIIIKRQECVEVEVILSLLPDMMHTASLPAEQCLQSFKIFSPANPGMRKKKRGVV